MNQPVQTQDKQQPPQDFTNLPVGEILRRTRMHYKRSIEDVEGALRIQSKQLEAIETGDTQALPARVYAIGFVRSYAEYLGLDGEKIVTLFKEQSGEAKAEPKVKLSTPQEHPKSPSIWIGGVLLVLLCIGLFFAFGSGGEKQVKKQPEIIPEVPKELKVDALEEKQKTAIAKPVKAAVKAEPPKPKGIVLKMLSDSWVEIRDKNRRKIISRVLKKGDQYFVPERLDLTISIGNAGGIAILVDGEPLDNIGVNGQVIRNIPLNAEALKTRFPKAPQKTIENTAENQ